MKDRALSALSRACERGDSARSVAELEREAWDAGATHAETEAILSNHAKADTLPPPSDAAQENLVCAYLLAPAHSRAENILRRMVEKSIPNEDLRDAILKAFSARLIDRGFDMVLP